MNNSEFDNISFDLPKNKSNVIKVIGVGGGGSNAINHMYEAGINGVDFVICNTDAQALQNSNVPNKIQLGVSLTEGLGAGANPDIGEQAAIESIEDLKGMLEHTTKMVFITAGMGGGTGTGAAPVIAKLARELDILTVGIVTTPFQFEGATRANQAQTGIERLRANVDSLIVINNNKLRDVYGNLGFKAGFSKADEVLATAAKGIAEVITHHYTQNIDLRDAKTVLSNSGTAIMGSSQSFGSSRANEAISKALDSPLLNDNKIRGAKNVLLLIVSGTEEITIDEIGEINDYIQNEAGHGANIIMGVGEDESLGEAIAITVIATGFNIDQQNEIVNTESKKIIHTLLDEQKAIRDLSEDLNKPTRYTMPSIGADDVSHATSELMPASDGIKDFNVVCEEVKMPEKVDFEMVDDFVIIPTTEYIVDIDVVEAKTVANDVVSTEEESMEQRSDFAQYLDAPKEENTVVFDLGDEIRDMEVNDVMEVSPEVAGTAKSVKKYHLEDYMTLEKELTEADEKKLQKTETFDEGITLRKKARTESVLDNAGRSNSDGDPINSSITEIMQHRAKDRRRTMKDFNHKFRNNPNSIDDIEKQPAYKRQGVDLSENNREQKVSRTSLSEDSNEEIQIRTNNSYLHGNVD